jgi:glycerol kinase
MDINTMFRLADAVAELGPAADGATMLLTPDLWTFRLGGTRAAERTIAGTTSMLDITTGTWDRDLLARLPADRRHLRPRGRGRAGRGHQPRQRPNPGLGTWRSRIRRAHPADCP